MATVHWDDRKKVKGCSTGVWDKTRSGSLMAEAMENQVCSALKDCLFSISLVPSFWVENWLWERNSLKDMNVARVCVTHRCFLGLVFTKPSTGLLSSSQSVQHVIHLVSFNHSLAHTLQSCCTNPGFPHDLAFGKGKGRTWTGWYKMVRIWFKWLFVCLFWLGRLTLTRLN